MLLSFLIFLSTRVYAADFDSHYASICGNEDCPVFVGTLAFVDRAESDKGTHICSATLVAEDEILTNFHCIPSQIRKAGVSCSESMEYLLPATRGLPAERIPCATIERVSATSPFGENQDVPDWALIKLKRPVHRSVAPVAQVPLEFGSQLHAYVSLNVDAGLSPIVEIQKVDCKVTELGYLQPLTYHPTAPLFALHGCTQPIVPGNSGSAFLDEAGHFVGLLSFSTTQRFQDANSLRQDGSPVAAGTKLLCIPLSGAELPESCRQDHDDQDFNAAATTFSVLRAFSREVQAHPPKLENNGAVTFAVGTVEERVRAFEAFYPDAGYASARRYFAQRNLTRVVADLDRLASQVLPKVPVCVPPHAAGASLDLNVFTYRDAELQPNSEGELFLNTAEDMSLVMLSRVVRVSLGGAADIWSANDEREYAACVAQLSSDHQHASSACKPIYAKKAFALYVKPFSLELPSCEKLTASAN